jgi:alkaline phosphatase
MRKTTLCGLLAALAGAAGAAHGQAKNIILLIADGAGYNTLEATRMWTGETQIYDGGNGWAAHPMAVYSLRVSPANPIDGPEGLEQDPAVVYDSQKNWDTTPIEGEAGGYAYNFAGYKWNRDTYPDSANTMSAMVTGEKTYNNAINVDGNGNSLLTLPEIAKGLGKSVGSVSSVPWTHATPAAGGGAHNISRNNYKELAAEMLAAGICDVIGGGGNPDYDSNGNWRDTPVYTYVGEPEWTALKAGTLEAEPGMPWSLAQTREEIEALASGPAPAKLVMAPTTGDTLQQTRSSAGDPKQTAPGFDPLRQDVPTLEVMTRVALNALGDNPEGFYLHVEGGAVDWAMHANQFGRMIEEHMDFLASIDAVAAYLDANTDGNNWSNTLVIITADHDHLVYGPNSSTIAYEPLQDNGPGNLPGHKWHSGSHSNHLVPIYARGPGAAALEATATLNDAYDDGLYMFGYGDYFHQIDLGRTLIAAVKGDVCLADLDGSGALDLFDFLIFVNRFNEGDFGADFDYSGSLDLFDFLGYTNSFNAGC